MGEKRTSNQNNKVRVQEFRMYLEVEEKGNKI